VGGRADRDDYEIYRSIEELRKGLDHWMERYNNEREPGEALSGPDSNGDVSGEHCVAEGEDLGYDEGGSSGGCNLARH